MKFTTGFLSGIIATFAGLILFANRSEKKKKEPCVSDVNDGNETKLFSFSTAIEGDSFIEVSQKIAECYEKVKADVEIKSVSFLCDGRSDSSIYQVKKDCFSVLEQYVPGEISFGIIGVRETDKPAMLKMVVQTTDPEWRNHLSMVSFVEE